MSTPGSSEWGFQYYGDPDSPGYVARNIVEIEFCGRVMKVHKKAQRAFKRFERIIKEHSPAWSHEIAQGTLDDWSYVNRDIIDPDTGQPTGRKSNHAFGLAIDIDALKNVRGHAPIDTSNWELGKKSIMQSEREDCLYWGGRFSTTADAMHFECHLTPAQVKLKYKRDGSRRFEKLRRRK